MKNVLIIGAVILSLCTLYFYIHHPLGKKVIINGHEIRLELAVTASEKEKGLGYRDSLGADRGMLFVYNHAERYGFWMKGMRFPLDFIWISGNTIVDLSENIPHPSGTGEPPATISPYVPSDKILEINAGMIKSLGIRIGDTVRFTN